MRLCLNIVLLSVCLYAVFAIDPLPPTSDGLFPFIEKLSILSRIFAGVAIQRQIHGEQSNAGVVIGELLNIPAPVFQKFLQSDIGSADKEVVAFFASINKTPYIALPQSDNLIEALKRLLFLKKNRKYLEPGTIADPVNLLSNCVKTTTTTAIIGEGVISQVNLNSTIHYLKQIHSAGALKLDNATRLTILSEFFQSVAALSVQLKDIRRYEQLFKNYLELSKSDQDNETALTASFFAANYSALFKKPEDFSNGLVKMSKEAAALTSPFNEQSKFSIIISALFSVISEDFQPNPVQINKKFTGGLPSFQQLSLISSDLQNAWFQQQIAKNQDVQLLATGLRSLESFHSTLSILNQQIDAVRNDKSLSKVASVKMLKALFVLSQSAEKLADGSASSASEQLATCLKQLRPITSHINVGELEKALQYTHVLAQRVRNFSNVMIEITGFLKNESESHVHDLRSLGAVFSNTSNITARNAIFDNITSKPYLKSLISELETVKNQLSQLSSQHFSVTSFTMDYTAIGNISNVFAGTKVFEATECLQESTVEKVWLTLKYNKLSEGVRKKLKDLAATEGAGKEIAKEIVDIQQSAKTLIQNLGSANLSEAESALVSFKGFENIVEQSRTAGDGLASLRNYRQLLKSEPSVMEYVNADAKLLQDVIRLAEQAGVVLKDEDRKQLVTTIAEVKKLDQEVAALPHETTVDLYKVFAVASKVNGVQMENASVFQTVIAREFGQEFQPPALKSIAQSFAELGELDLNFARHKTSLQAAPQAFNGLELEFTNYVSAGGGIPPKQNINDYSFIAYALFICLAINILVHLCYLLYYFLKDLREYLKLRRGFKKMHKKGKGKSTSESPSKSPGKKGSTPKKKKKKSEEKKKKPKKTKKTKKKKK